MTHHRVSANQDLYLHYIGSHPGCCTMDVVRACRHNPRAGHKWIYDSVARLIRRGFVRAVTHPTDRRKGALYLQLDRPAS